MVHTMRLALACADLDIMWKASLRIGQLRTSLRVASFDRASTRMEELADGRTHPHCGMERTCNLIILLQTRTATQYLWQPELLDSAFHVGDLSLRWCGSLDPLGRFSPHTAYHVCVGERLWSPLTGLHTE